MEVVAASTPASADSAADREIESPHGQKGRLRFGAGLCIASCFLLFCRGGNQRSVKEGDHIGAGIAAHDVSGGDSICGEVYCVDDATLARLDQYEGEGSLYLRKNARVHGSYGAVTAMFYEYAGELCGAQRIDGWRDRGEDRVWYAAYGSNLQADRFRCYLQGGTCKENGRSYPGCSDKTLWKKSKVRSFKGRLYFGNRSSSWNHGGVAFFDPEGEGEVWMRLYRISRQQLLEIQQQEGCSDAWYGNLVFLGTEQDDRPVYTFTSAEKREKHAPDSAYLELIRTALMKECGMNKRKADRYLAKACE